jgi:hypothetical protein
MMLKKIRELSGAALQYAVMLAEDWSYFPAVGGQCAVYGRNRGHTQVWAVAGPDYLNGPAGDEIIDRENISTTWLSAEECKDRSKAWNGYVAENFAYSADEDVNGATRREAAMRAWVQHKLGDKYFIPKEFL